MAQTPWSGLLTGSSTPLLATGDIVAFVDVSDATQSPSGSLVKATVSAYLAALPSAVNILSASANALTVGRLGGTTTPAFVVDASTASQVAGLKVVGAATGGTVAIVAIDSGADTNVTINAKGTGTIGIGSVSTGRVTITPVVTITGALTQTGLATFNGGATIASGQTLTVTGATITGLIAASVGAGTFPGGSYAFTGATTLTGGAGDFTIVAGTGASRSLILRATTAASAATTVVTLADGTAVFNTIALSGISTIATSSTINSQTISATANFTGTVTVATGLTVSAGGITVTGNSTITGTLGGVTTLTATTLGGTLSTAAQPNVTSVGTLTGLTVNGASILDVQGGGAATIFRRTSNPYVEWQTSAAASQFLLGNGSAVSGNAGFYDLYAQAALGIRAYVAAGTLAMSLTTTGASRFPIATCTATSTTTVNTGGATTLFDTGTTTGMYLVFAYNTAGARFAWASVANDGNQSVRMTSSSSVASFDITTPGGNGLVQLTNTTGSNYDVTWAYLRVA